jgi:transposase
MAMGERGIGPEQGEFWIETQKLVQAPGHPFYRRLNQILKERDFDRFCGGACEKFYKEEGRPSVPPSVYFRMLLIGYFEGLDSERGIAWHCADSFSLREFLGYALTEETPEHSTLSRIRQRIDLETHRDVFTWVLKVVAETGLISGKTAGVDATTLEANAAMRSIIRRDSGEKYEEFLTRLAKESGIETPTREDLANLDRKRPHKGSNDDWQNPHDPDARITKMKDGRTHLAHKAEHAVDMDSGAVLAVTLQHADLGDTTTIYQTVTEATENLEKIAESAQLPEPIKPYVEEVVADKGYHSNEVLTTHEDAEIRTYISEPDRGQRNWENKERAQKAVYSNRRRIKGERGKRLMRQRGELVERSFAHCYETGAMRRTHLKGHAKIIKRLLIHVAAFNLSLILRKLFGNGTPKEMAEAAKSLVVAVFCAIRVHIAQYRKMDTTALTANFYRGRVSMPEAVA